MNIRMIECDVFGVECVVWKKLKIGGTQAKNQWKRIQKRARERETILQLKIDLIDY